VASAARRARLVARLHALAPPRRDGADVRVVRAPGRVNLIGEHTDYNLGFVMPVAIGLETWIAAVERPDRRVELTSLAHGDTRTFELDRLPPPGGSWIDYVAGTAWSLMEAGVALRGLTGVVETTIPIGAGLSSSAALELAAAWALSSQLPPPLAPLALARAAQRAENEYVGVNSGLMDQFAATFGARGAALLLDCRSLEQRAIALPAGFVLVAVDSRSPHRLGASQYNARRAQCEAAVAALAVRHPTVRSLRDVDRALLGDLAELVDETTVRRVRHVVEENDRVVAAAAALEVGRVAEVGRLMAESHASLRDLYEVSSVELDALVAIAESVEGVTGARMTGAGFGGCTVNLVSAGAVDRLRAAIATEYPRLTGGDARCYVVSAVEGAGPGI